MTIQRKYSLPNCTLILEGLSATNDTQDPRPVLSLLVNAECRLANSKEVISGGRDFFESLVKAVSGYAQEFLSQVTHPEAHDRAELVQLDKIDANRHRLSVHPENKEQESDSNTNLAPKPIEINLTTVQLFDLVEAVDQFFADSQTLPDLSLQLSPVSKRYTSSSQQLVKQAVPATVGATGLALAAIAFFFVPIPEVQRPPETAPQSNSRQSTLLATAPTITDPSQLTTLNQKLYDQIDRAWKTRSTIIQDLSYRVGVANSGAIRGYVAVNEAANSQVQLTPLSSLLSLPTAGSTATPEPLAQFQVTFTKGGELQVKPWEGKR